MLDFKDKDLYDLVQEAMLASKRGTLDQSHYASYLRRYAGYLRPENRLTVGVTRAYPWVRFTIFDDSAVSFIYATLP